MIAIYKWLGNNNNNNNSNIFCLNTSIWDIGMNQWCNQKIANMLSEIVYTGITNLYIIMKNQQDIKQYIINVNSVFWRAPFLVFFWKCPRYCSREGRLLIVFP